MTNSRADKHDIYESIYEVVRLVPPGRVTTYGAVAAAIGLASGARMVGYAMHASHGRMPIVPAHRVVNRIGLLTGKHHFASLGEMQRLLEEEGVAVENDQVIDFAGRFWDPVRELS